MNNEHKSSNDDLDQLVQRALRVRPAEPQLGRLEIFWRQQSSRQRRQRQLLVALPIAAAATWLAILAFLPQPHPAATPKADIDLAKQQHETASNTAMLVARTPTAHERFLFTANRTRHLASTSAEQWASLDNAISQLAEHPNLDPASIFAATKLDCQVAETKLLRQVKRFSVPQQRATLRLLTKCGSFRSTPTLLQLARNKEIREEALTTLEQLVDYKTLATLVSQSSSTDIRATLMQRLLADGSKPAIQAYLPLCREETTSYQALAIMKQRSPPPIETLFYILDHEEESQRLSAALVLGHLNGPIVTQSLIARITDDPENSEDAWIAMIACRGELAESFKAYAAYRPLLLGQYNHARIRWIQMIH